MQSAHIPGLALAIVERDEVVYLKGFGSADPSGRPVRPETPFIIGSITKTITALAVLQLVDAGKLVLDAPVQRYLPWFRVADARASSRITVRHLLTMTSGLPQSYVTQLWSDDDDRVLERTVRFYRDKELTHPVGSAFSYSNANYDVLGLIVAVVSGQSYEDYIESHVFAPLAMHNGFVSQREAMAHGMAMGHRWWFGFPVAVTLPYIRAELPAGYVIASAEDMSHLMIAELNDGRFDTSVVLSPRSMALRHTPTPFGYGFGWESPRMNGRQLFNHEGGTENFQTSLFLDPAARTGVYVAANVINALDAFSTPPGLSKLDGQTTRAMARVILNIATHEPRPGEGLGHERLTLLYDAVMLVLTAALVRSLVGTGRRLRRPLARRPVWRAIGFALLHFVFPLALLYCSLAVPAWQVIARFQPDLALWLAVAAILLFVAGMIELSWRRRVTPSLAARAARRTAPDPPPTARRALPSRGPGAV